MRGDAIGCADARLHRVLTTHVMSLICEAAAIASCWQSVLINIGFCMQSFCFILGYFGLDHGFLCIQVSKLPSKYRQFEQGLW